MNQKFEKNNFLSFNCHNIMYPSSIYINYPTNRFHFSISLNLDQNYKLNEYCVPLDSEDIVCTNKQSETIYEPIFVF